MARGSSELPAGAPNLIKGRPSPASASNETRPRTPPRVVQRGPATQCFIATGALSPPAPVLRPPPRQQACGALHELPAPSGRKHPPPTPTSSPFRPAALRTCVLLCLQSRTFRLWTAGGYRQGDKRSKVMSNGAINATLPDTAAAPVPPQNLDAEESVLGAMMLSAGAIGAVSEVLDADGREFYRESHAKIYRAALALYAKGEPVDAITLVDELDERGRARGGRRRGPASTSSRRSSRRARTRATTRRSSTRRRPCAASSGPAARSPGSAGSGPASDRARRPGRADRLRPLAGARTGRVQPHRGAPQGELRAHHRPLRVGRRRHRRSLRLPRPRPHHVGLPGGEPDHPRRPPEHGEVGARPRHGREPRRPPQRPGRPLHARDVEGGGDAAAHVQRGEGRVAAAAHRQARRPTTGRASRPRATSSRRRRSTSTTPARSR